MRTLLPNWLKRTSRLLPVLLLPLAAQAQFYTAANVTNTTGAYTDLGTTGTAIATANTDDANSAATPIGFTFTYNGTAFTDFVLNTNGFVKLGTAAPTGAQYTDGGQSIINGPIDGADTNLILPFNQDLGPGSAGGTEYRVLTTGTAPNRVCTIQWKNVSDKPRTSVGTQYANFSFQAKLYETSNQIDFVYGAATAGVPAADVAKFCIVGVKGSSATASVLAMKVSTLAWAGTTFLTGPYTVNGHNVRGTVLPDPGRTYRFSVPVANDAAASVIQGYASVVVPASNPLTIRGIVSNTGTTAFTTAIPVTLTISGANTYTQTQNVASLALGATEVVTFSGITLPNVGQNTVTLSVPSDGNNTNNSVSQPMETSATTFSLATPGAPSPANSFNPGYNRYYAAKMTLSTARSITAVSALLTDAGSSATIATSVGETVYGVVIDITTGAVLARSPDYVITAADLRTFHTFPLSAPATVPAGDVLVGMFQTASATGLPYYPFGVQAEDPTRPNTYYIGSLGQAPTVALTAAGQTIYKFPFGAVTAAPANSDVAVDDVQGYGSVAVPAGNPVSLRAVVRNGGTSALTTPLVVTLNITGANTVTQTQTVTSLAVGATAVVTFTGLNLTTAGANTVTVTVPTDDNLANNSLAQPLATSATRFSFIVPGVPVAGGNGFGTPLFASTRALCAKFTVNTPCNVTAVRAFIVNTPTLATQSNTVFGVVLNAMTGAVISRSPDYVITTADLGQLHTFNLRAQVPAGDFLVGLAQVLVPGTAGFFPLGSQNEVPSRADLYYFADISNPTTPITLVAGGGTGSNRTRLMLEAETSIVLATSEALRQAVSVFPNPSTSGVFNVEIHGANARQGLGVEVVNMLGQRVYTGTAKDNFSTAVDLSGLASGIYTLPTLRNGQEYTQQKISIMK